MTIKYPYLGYGLGLRTNHYDYVLTNLPAVDWFEIITEDFLVEGGRPLHYLQRINEHYPLVMHGVSLSIGSADPINWEYLKKIKQLAENIQPAWISDHLCWTGIKGRNTHDLLPLPYTEEAIQHIVSKLRQVQDFLERRILLENVSSYITYRDSSYTEWDFLTTIAEEADSLILLDINNIYVSAFNHQFSAEDYLSAIPVSRVQQFHLAGYTHCDTHIIDTHDHPISTDVWHLYKQAVQRFGNISTMIERDDNIPEFPELLAELVQAKAIAKNLIEFPKNSII